MARQSSTRCSYRFSKCPLLDWLSQRPGRISRVGQLFTTCSWRNKRRLIRRATSRRLLRPEIIKDTIYVILRQGVVKAVVTFRRLLSMQRNLYTERPATQQFRVSICEQRPVSHKWISARRVELYLRVWTPPHRGYSGGDSGFDGC
ncbi:hypothetical protein LSAT2_006503, partial [Lamellibrachia satsuma]